VSAARRLGAALACALVAAAPARAAPAGTAPQISIEAPALVGSSERLSFTVVLQGPLADSRPLLFLFVDANLVREVPTRGARTEIVLEGLALEPGEHELTVKSGTYLATSRFRRVRPRDALLAAGGVVLTVAVALLPAWRRRRRRRG
jgi:hypothetical protein